MKRRNYLRTFVVIVFLVAPMSAFALEPIPEKTGFSGFLRLGGGVLNYKGNTVAGNDFIDVSNDTITSINQSPDDETKGTPAINYKLAYTYAPTRTQINLGSSLEDIARLEVGQQFAVQQELPDKSMVSLGLLFTGIPTEVWKDPYLENAPRQKTDRDSKGLKFAFDDILGSKFEFVYTYRDIEIDDEQGGYSQFADQARRDLLRRDGDNHKASLLYRFNIDNRHFIEPGVSYFDEDRDGDAMSNDGYEVQLTYLYQQNPFSAVVTGMFGQADYDTQNPLYGKTQEIDLYLLGLQLYYKEPFGWKPFGSNGFSVYCSFAYFQEDANIDFYDIEVTSVDVGVLFRF